MIYNKFYLKTFLLKLFDFLNNYLKIKNYKILINYSIHKTIISEGGKILKKRISAIILIVFILPLISFVNETNAETIKIDVTHWDYSKIGFFNNRGFMDEIEDSLDDYYWIVNDVVYCFKTHLINPNTVLLSGNRWYLNLNYEVHIVDGESPDTFSTAFNPDIRKLLNKYIADGGGYIAVDNTSDGGVVYVIGGEYTNGVVVNKSLSFYGGEGNTVISAPVTGVSIVSNNVSMDSFIIKDAVIGIAVSGRLNCTITECDFLNSISGVKIDDGAEQNVITSCNFSNNTYGVYLSGSESNIVGSPSVVENPVWDDCIFTSNNYGVYIEGGEANYIMGCKINASLSGPGSPSSGIYIDNSKNNTVLLCDVVDASNYGIYISGSSNNTILNCIVRENDKGVYLSSSSYNSIIGNNISKNSESGVNIMTMSSSSNSILFNDFIGNGGVFYPQASDSGTGNNWNTSNNNTYLYSGQGEGNNWSDYTGSDSEGDGIGDTSYSISGTANGKDYYPVMMDYGWLDKWY